MNVQITASSREPEFTALMDSHRGILHAVANGYCREPEDRADLIQDMVLQLWRAWPDYCPDQRFWAAAVQLDEADTDLAADPEIDESGDGARLLERLIGELDPLNRALILLFLDGQDNRTIAEVLGITRTNVSTRLSRLKARLMREFEERSQ